MDPIVSGLAAWSARWRRRVRYLIGRGRAEREMDEEFRLHLELEIEENVRRGMTPAEARRQALLAFGGVERFKEEAREARGVEWVVDFTADLRRTARRLLRSPGFALPVVLMLAIGIGAAAAVYTLVDAVLLRPLPYPDADRLVVVRHAAPGLGIDETGQSDGTYVYYHAENHSFTGMGAYWTVAYTLTGGRQPERVHAAIISPSTFAVLGVPPYLGQWPAQGEDGFGTVMIGYGLWQRRYGGDPGIIGREIELNGGSPGRRVVGVMPPGFAFPTPGTEFWFANPITSADKARLGVHSMFISTLARLRPGVSPQAAARDLDHLIPGLAGVYPDASTELLHRSRLHVIVRPLKASVLRHIRPLLLLLSASVAVILVIVWANAMTLVLLRAERQQPVTALERALGATAGDVVRRWSMEVGLLTLTAGLGGFVLSALTLSAHLGFSPGQVPRLEGVRLDEAAVAVVALLTLLSAGMLLTVGLARTFQLRRSARPGRAGARATSGRERLRVHRSLVAGQVALAVALLIGSALLQRSFSRLAHVDLGFDPGGVVILDTALPYGAPYATYDSKARFWGRLLAQLRVTPGVVAAEAVGQQGLPLTPIDELTNDAVVGLPLRGPVSAALDTTAATSATATPGYFRAMRIRLLAGRTFESGDLRSGLRPIIISASLAHELFRGGPALNRKLRFTKLDPKKYPPFTVVGVVDDVPGEGVADGASRRLYLPVLDDLRATPNVDPRIPYWPSEMSLVVRTKLPTVVVASEARRIANSLDPQVPVWGERTLDSVVAGSMANVRLITLLFLVATATALGLAVLGIYGVISYAVNQRTRELGVRLAIGATPAVVTRMVLRDGARIAIVGIAAGLVVAALSTRLLRAVLYQVSPSDPRAFLLMPVLLFGLALLGAYLPARRAGRTDPVTAIRTE